MPDPIRRLTEMIAANGYLVAYTQGPKGTMVDIVHEPTQRESTYGFNPATQATALRAMASQYCTIDQLNELARFGVDLLEPRPMVGRI